MISLAEGFQIAAAVGTLVYGYIKLSHMERAELKKKVSRWGSYTGAAVVGVASIIEVYKFGTSDAPITRRDVLWLLLNIWNGVAYIGCGVALAMVWHKLDRKQKAEQTEQLPIDKS